MSNFIKPRVMLMSLGGSPEPLSKSIQAYEPERIIFFASHDSVSLAGDIFKKAGFKPATEYEITENPNLMFECYQAARRCVDRVKATGISPDEIMIDYTGGTKVMTAALVMATAGYDFHFNYVGGDFRDKNGVGVVTDGHEKMFAEMNPWSIFAEEERRQVVTLFNQQRFGAVIEIIDSIVISLPVQVRDYFQFVRPCAEALLHWDQFEHGAAIRKISTGMDYLSRYIDSYKDTSLKSLIRSFQECQDFLRELMEKTNGLKVYHEIIITDLLNNAKRKISTRRYDDAAARIYRALELYGQIAFLEVAGCPNNKVKPELIPDVLREDFIPAYLDKKTRLLKLPQQATFQFLKEKGHEAGIRFFALQREMKKIQQNRNESILAHGLKPVSEKSVLSILDTVVGFVQEDIFFDFPKLPAT